MDESLSNYTLCDKHSISLTPSSSYDKFADLQWNFCGSYVILYFETIDSTIVVYCGFAMQSYAIFLRWSRLNFSVRIDFVLLTELNQSLLGYSEEFCSSTPCPGSVERLEDFLLLSLGIAARQVFGCFGYGIL